MNGLELIVLGRTLMKIGGQAIPETGLPRLPSTVRSILVDVMNHPDSSVRDITARTGFPQSHVSAAVAKLQQAGAVETATDPKDRRRTLVRAHPEATRETLQVASAPIDGALAAALDTDDSREVREVVAALEALADRLGVAGRPTGPR